MANVTGLTAARMLAIEAACIVQGAVDLNGHLILTKYSGAQIDAGDVKGPTGPKGDKGDKGDQGPPGADAAPGDINPTAGTTPIRDTDGRVKGGTPTEANDLTTKSFVEGMTWDANDIVSGTIDKARLPGKTMIGIGAQGASADTNATYPTQTDVTGTSVSLSVLDGDVLDLMGIFDMYGTSTGSLVIGRISAEGTTYGDAHAGSSSAASRSTYPVRTIIPITADNASYDLKLVIGTSGTGQTGVCRATYTRLYYVHYR